MATATAPHRSFPTWPGVAARGVRRGVAELAAIAQVALGATVVVAAAERRSVLNSANHGRFSAWFAGPLRGLVPGLTRSPAALHRDLREVLFLMVAAWLVVLLGGRTVRAPVVIGSVVAIVGLFLLCPPLARTDVFNYLGYARLDALHHANPYVQLPLLNRGDPVYAYSNWHRLRSPYGPVFTLLVLPTARLPLPVAYWLYKGVTAAATLGLLAAVWACARRLGRPPAQAVAFAGLNPVLLVFALGGQHNDLLMAACLLASALLILERREVLGGVTLVAALAIKASAGLLAPVVALAAPRRWRAAAGLAAGGAGLVALTLLAFGGQTPDLSDQDRLVDSYSFPNLIGYALGHGGADAPIRRLMTIMLIAGTAVCALVAWRTRRFATPAGFAGLLGVVCVSWLMPWYVLLALPFAALSRSRTLRVATVLMTAWLVFVWTGLGPTLANQHGIHVASTHVARVNRRFTDRLLLDHARRHRANRRPTSGQPRHTRQRRSLGHGDRRSPHVPPPGGRRSLARPVDRAPVSRRGGQHRHRRP
jgi:Glycosyltransferase family 87